MVFDENLLINKKILIKHIRIGLHDVNFKCVKMTGSVMLNEHRVIHDVLLVEGFKHNLLSVGKLVEKSDILVQFTKDTCHF